MVQTDGSHGDSLEGQTPSAIHDYIYTKGGVMMTKEKRYRHAAYDGEKGLGQARGLDELASKGKTPCSGNTTGIRGKVLEILLLRWPQSIQPAVPPVPTPLKGEASPFAKKKGSFAKKGNGRLRHFYG